MAGLEALLRQGEQRGSLHFWRLPTLGQLSICNKNITSQCKYSIDILHIKFWKTCPFSFLSDLTRNPGVDNYQWNKNNIYSFAKIFTTHCVNTNAFSYRPWVMQTTIRCGSLKSVPGNEQINMSKQILLSSRSSISVFSFRLLIMSTTATLYAILKSLPLFLDLGYSLSICKSFSVFILAFKTVFCIWKAEVKIQWVCLLLPKQT